MTRVSTLRVIFGHPKLTEALLRCFFDADRRAENRVKRLWLDNVNIVAGTEQLSTFEKYWLPLKLDFRGVEKLRLRRLPLLAKNIDDQYRLTRRTQVVYSRGGRAAELSDGLGGNYLTTTSFAGAEIVPGLEQAEQAGQDVETSQQLSPLETLMHSANRFDDAIYDALSLQYKFPAEMMVLIFRRTTSAVSTLTWIAGAQTTMRTPNKAMRLSSSSGPKYHLQQRVQA
jgi:hypothetical protein